MHIPMASPDLTDAEVAAVNAVIRSPSLSIGPQIVAFERALAAYTGVAHGVGVNSGTSGLHLCMIAAGVADGDPVITSPFSFIASSNSILYERGLPLFVDVDPATGVPLISSADGQRHYEIFEGATRDGGASFTWTAVTHDSVADNIRPTMPPSDGTYRALVWLRGTYRTYSDYELSVVALAAPLGTRFGVPPLIARATPSMRPPRTD